jgi:hypothetical protein
VPVADARMSCYDGSYLANLRSGVAEWQQRGAVRGASTMIAVRFKVGDRVMSRVAKLEVPAGARGAILRPAGSKQYIVQFATTLTLMRSYELAHTEPLSEAQTQEQEVAR